MSITAVQADISTIYYAIEILEVIYLAKINTPQKILAVRYQ